MRAIGWAVNRESAQRSASWFFLANVRLEVENRPADVVPQPLVVEDDLADRLRELFPLPLALESSCGSPSPAGAAARTALIAYAAAPSSCAATCATARPWRSARRGTGTSGRPTRQIATSRLRRCPPDSVLTLLSCRRARPRPAGRRRPRAEERPGSRTRRSRTPAARAAPGPTTCRGRARTTAPCLLGPATLGAVRRVHAEGLHASRAPGVKALQDFDRGGLAGSVRPEQCYHLPLQGWNDTSDRTSRAPYRIRSPATSTTAGLRPAPSDLRQ